MRVRHFMLDCKTDLVVAMRTRVALLVLNWHCTWGVLSVHMPRNRVYGFQPAHTGATPSQLAVTHQGVVDIKAGGTIRFNQYTPPARRRPSLATLVSPLWGKLWATGQDLRAVQLCHSTWQWRGTAAELRAAWLLRRGVSPAPSLVCQHIDRTVRAQSIREPRGVCMIYG